MAVVLPLAIFYEVGTRLFHVDAAAQTETRVLAFVWLRDLISPGAAAAWLVPAAAVIALAAWHVFAGHAWQLRPTVPIAMSMEATLLAVPLLAAVWLIGGMGLLAMAAGGVGGNLVLAAGAGVFEEFVFRLFGFAVGHALLAPVFGNKGSLAVTLVITSLAFAGYHHLPAAGEPFGLSVFGFRSLAGLWLGLIFLTRGFGVTVACHTAYNGLVTLLPVSLVTTS